MELVYDLDTINIRFISHANIPETIAPDGEDYISFSLKPIKGIIVHGERFIDGNTWYYIIFETVEAAIVGTRRINTLNKEIFEFKEVNQCRYIEVTKAFALNVVSNKTPRIP